MTTEQIKQQVELFISCYQTLTKDNLQILNDIYDPNIIFEDPAHRIEGFTALFQYFQNLYINVTTCHFEIEHYAINDSVAFVNWNMHLSHPKLFKGKLNSLQGCSKIKFQHNKVIYQRDYFDLGKMLYEGIPILDCVIRQIKKRLGK